MSGSIIVAGQAGNEMTRMVTGLTNYGYTVFPAENGEAAAGLVKEKKELVAIIIGSALQGLSASDLCKQIKQIGRLDKVPVFILEDKGFLQTTYADLGITQFFKEPFSTTAVVREIKSLSSDAGPLVGKQNTGKQLIGVWIALAIALCILTFFIFIPLMAGGSK